MLEKKFPLGTVVLEEKLGLGDDCLVVKEENPVLESAELILNNTNLVTIDKAGVENAAEYIARKLREESYTPTTWRTHPLHLCPPETFSPSDPRTRDCLDWIFLISSLNFSFWSDLEGAENERKRYGVEWRTGWGSNEDDRTVHTGYWSLVAAIDKALEAGIPIFDPGFYSSPERCPDATIASIFAPDTFCAESIPLLRERIAIMRENGSILCQHFGGSFYGFIEYIRQNKNYSPCTSALQLVKSITETFPSFRDQCTYQNRPVYFWKRAQILVAETWAAFYPLHQTEPHPFFPEGVGELTMFADYRVPQILHHLGILSYAPSLVSLLKGRSPLEHGSMEEMAIRAGSIVAVEEVRKVICQNGKGDVSSVIIDFYLWDLAKRIEGGDETVNDVRTREVLPAHRTRSIWY